MHVVIRGRCGLLHLLLHLGSMLLTWLGSDRGAAAGLDYLINLGKLVDVTISLFR